MTTHTINSSTGETCSIEIANDPLGMSNPVVSITSSGSLEWVNLPIQNEQGYENVIMSGRFGNATDINNNDFQLSTTGASWTIGGSTVHLTSVAYETTNAKHSYPNTVEFNPSGGNAGASLRTFLALNGATKVKIQARTRGQNLGHEMVLVGFTDATGSGATILDTVSVPAGFSDTDDFFVESNPIPSGITHVGLGFINTSASGQSWAVNNIITQFG